MLPKGRVEEGEQRKDAALREVLEETGVKAEILKYLGETITHIKRIGMKTRLSIKPFFGI